VKHLYLLRHAKSSWNEPSLSDSERPLNGRGRRDAPRMGAALSARLAPMTFHVSPAERAQQTFSAVQQHWAGLEVQHGVTAPALYTCPTALIVSRWWDITRRSPSSLISLPVQARWTIYPQRVGLSF